MKIIKENSNLVKTQTSKMVNWKWSFKVLILTLALSISFSIISETVLNSTTIIISVFIIFLFLFINVTMDMIGVAITAGDINKFKQFEKDNVKGSREVVQLLKKRR